MSTRSVTRTAGPSVDRKHGEFVAVQYSTSLHPDRLICGCGVAPLFTSFHGFLDTRIADVIELHSVAILHPHRELGRAGGNGTTLAPSRPRGAVGGRRRSSRTGGTART